jgi:hypothetical protein
MSEKIGDSPFESNSDEQEGGDPKERLISSVNGFVDDRDADKFIIEVAKVPEIEASLLDFEQVKRSVEMQGTITHVCKQVKISESGKITPLEFWLRTGLGEAISHYHRFPVENSTSVNVTAWDGFNSSVEGGIDWSLKDENGQFGDLNLIVFSKKAVEKIAGTQFEPSNNLFLNLIERYWDEKDSLHGSEFFNALRVMYGVDYIPPKETFNSPEWTINQKRFALYERLCLMKSNNEFSFDRFYRQHQYEIEEITRYLKHEGKNYGFRYRGVYEKDGQKHWGPLEATSEDVSRIIIPIEPGKNYLSMNFLEHPQL